MVEKHSPVVVLRGRPRVVQRVGTGGEGVRRVLRGRGVAPGWAVEGEVPLRRGLRRHIEVGGGDGPALVRVPDTVDAGWIIRHGEVDDLPGIDVDHIVVGDNDILRVGQGDRIRVVGVDHLGNARRRVGLRGRALDRVMDG